MKLYPHERQHEAMCRAGPELHKALYDLLHALHPASQRVAAANAWRILATVASAAEEQTVNVKTNVKTG